MNIMKKHLIAGISLISPNVHLDFIRKPFSKPKAPPPEASGFRSTVDSWNRQRDQRRIEEKLGLAEEGGRWWRVFRSGERWGIWGYARGLLDETVEQSNE